MKQNKNTFDDFLKKKGIVLRPWQRAAAYALLAVMYEYRLGATGKSFLLKVLCEFVSTHGNMYEI